MGWLLGVAGWVRGCGRGEVLVWSDSPGSLREGEGDGIVQVYRVGVLGSPPGVLRVISHYHQFGDVSDVLPVCWDIV